jgi:hypothetical protein
MIIVYLQIPLKVFHMFARFISLYHHRTWSSANVAPALDVRMSAMLLLLIAGSYKASRFGSLSDIRTIPNLIKKYICWLRQKLKCRDIHNKINIPFTFKEGKIC